MTEIHNFSLYLPDDKNLLKLNALFLKSEDGRDWYESQQLFSPGTVKVVFHQADGIIVSFSRDVSTLWPVGLSVAEVPDDEMTSRLKLNMGFVYKNGQIIERKLSKAELEEKAEREKTQRLRYATETARPFQDAVDLNMATEAEKSSLLAWKKYRVLLNRLDISTAPDIDWPIPPDNDA